MISSNGHKEYGYSRKRTHYEFDDDNTAEGNSKEITEDQVNEDNNEQSEPLTETHLVEQEESKDHTDNNQGRDRHYQNNNHKPREQYERRNNNYQQYNRPNKYQQQQSQHNEFDKFKEQDPENKKNLLYGKLPRNQDKNQSKIDWETDQFKRAQQLQLQTDDKIHIGDDKEYEYVFDESQFVKFDDEEGDILDEDAENENNVKQIDLKEIENVKNSLPVFQYKQEFLKLVEENQFLIVVGETGSGKTTQLPQYLYEAGYSENNTKLIGITQPRRIAASSVASRVSNEMNTKLGDKVGYSIRFDEKTSENTVIKFSTDGMLLREFLNDPFLSQYKVIMIDEAHERTLSTEILLSLLKDLCLKRKDLKLIIASATINAKKFSDFFNNSPILNIPGRRFPVKIHYTKQPEANYLNAIMTTIFQIHLTQPLPGDILVFLTGQEEIEKLENQLNESIFKLKDQLEDKKMIVCVIYANLPNDLQYKIFEPTPPNTRKIILATNIAETSITINGISYVIDSGYVKQNEYNPTSGMESLVVVPCSKANCDQRAGRAGRIGPGKCFRIFTKYSFDNDMEPSTKPEIQRLNLNSIVLLLLSLGINDLLNFEFLDSPPKQNLIKSLNLLYSFEAITINGKLTKLGFKMNEFPLDPILTKCIIESEKFKITKEICIIISMLTESSNLRFKPKKTTTTSSGEFNESRFNQFNHKQGDHITLLNIYLNWYKNEFSKEWCNDNFIQYKTMKRIKNIYMQLIQKCEKIGLLDSKQKQSINEDSSFFEITEEKLISIQKVLLKGFFNNIVKLSTMGNCYENLTQTKSKIPCFIHPSSVLYKKPKQHNQYQQIPQQQEGENSVTTNGNNNDSQNYFKKPKFLMYYELVLTSKEYMRNCMIIDEKLIKNNKLIKE
ncbi:uncharacterized protein KGF55_001366 [Candida pseudojiufengensis]|uniref:uncharacterized protein n=1 Tax=Candida pseudojiufengensis TaxID=497109 RepID=UPI0022251378|nr:uncharacterized protein KGF55_001366 [Candida pseudojiufengensis]KAI5965146.1 hypothetical protein KGF55_001366 [Candida pseudojiufengensis]